MRPRTVWVINQYISTPDTGIGGRHYYLARELVKQGHNVYLVAASFTHLLRQPPEINSTFEEKEVDGIHLIWIKVPRYKGAHDKRRVFNWFIFAWYLLKLPEIIKENPDAILASSPAPFVFITAKRLAKKYKAKLIFEVRDIWPLTLVEVGGFSPKHPFMQLMQWVEDRAYRDSEIVISNLPYAVEHMKHRGMSAEKFAWIPNGFSRDEVGNSMPLSDEVNKLLPRDKFIVGYTGTIGLANALDSFVEAAEILKNDDSIVFVIVGGGKEKTRLLARVKSSSLENVIFINPIPKTQIQSMLKQFNACYIGLTSDPLFQFGVSPNKLFDYLYSSRPVIYAIDSGKYLPVNEARAGLSIPAENPQSIVDAVKKLKDMPSSERQSMGDRGRKYVEKYHDYKNLAIKLSNLLFKDNA